MDYKTISYMTIAFIIIWAIFAILYYVKPNFNDVKNLIKYINKGLKLWGRAAGQAMRK